MHWKSFIKPSHSTQLMFSELWSLLSIMHVLWEYIHHSPRLWIVFKCTGLRIWRIRVTPAMSRAVPVYKTCRINSKELWFKDDKTAAFVPDGKNFTELYCLRTGFKNSFVLITVIKISHTLECQISLKFVSCYRLLLISPHFREQ